MRETHRPSMLDHRMWWRMRALPHLNYELQIRRVPNYHQSPILKNPIDSLIWCLYLESNKKYRVISTALYHLTIEAKTIMIFKER